MRVIVHLTYVLYPLPTGGDYTESIQYTGRHEKAGLKISIQKTKVMATGDITSWQIDGEKMETVTDFIFLGSKPTGAGDCSYEI